MKTGGLIDLILPIVRKEGASGRPVSREKIARILKSQGHDVRSCKRALVCTMADHTVNSAHTGRSADLPKYFNKVMGDSWICLEHMDAYRAWIGMPIADFKPK